MGLNLDRWIRSGYQDGCDLSADPGGRMMDIIHDRPLERITSRAHLTAVCQQARDQWDHVQAIVLFGSQAKGTARTDSD